MALIGVTARGISVKLILFYVLLFLDMFFTSFIETSFAMTLSEKSTTYAVFALFAYFSIFSVFSCFFHQFSKKMKKCRFFRKNSISDHFSSHFRVLRTYVVNLSAEIRTSVDFTQELQIHDTFLPSLCAFLPWGKNHANGN